MIVSVEIAIDLLLQGEVIGIPTDTVYGLAVSMHDANAMEKIFELKKRNLENPLIMLAAKLSQIEPFLIEKPKGFYDLADRFWPGALTMLMPVDTKKVHQHLRSKSGKTGFRIPDCSSLLSVLDYIPVASTSANLSDYPPATSKEDFESYFGPDFPVLESLEKPKGTASTVVEYDDEKWRLIREGGVKLPVGFER